MNMDKVLAELILRNALKFDWSLQGFGLLRLHWANFRLHVWDSRYAVPHVSMIHDHQQWHFTSHVIVGKVINIRYTIHNSDGERYMCQRIKAGYGSKAIGKPAPIGLVRQPNEVYKQGGSYRQHASEIHETRAEDGTVTVLEKEPQDDRDGAIIYFRENEKWVSAEPRKASKDEVNFITKSSLERWFK